MKNNIEEILNFFDPIEVEDFTDKTYFEDKASFGNNIIINFKDRPILASDRFESAFIFIDQEKQVGEHKETTCQRIREEIYKLKKVASKVRIADLGNLRCGKNFSETIFSLQESTALLLKNKVNLIIIGGSHALTIGAYRGIKEFENDINLVSIDSRIDLSFDERPIEESFLDTIIEKEASSLYNIACIGYQSYFVDQRQLGKLSEMYFEEYRLGKVRENIGDIEPILRDADIVSFDMSSIRMSDSPGCRHSSPNGFYGEEACQLSRYAGLSDRLRIFGIFEADSGLENKNRQTTKLSAQIIWYYLEGYINRKHDYPQASLEEYTKYIVEIDEIGFPIVFYKSNKSKRWWIEIENPHSGSDDRLKVVVSCHENDYIKACNNEIPEKWWNNFKKLR